MELDENIRNMVAKLQGLYEQSYNFVYPTAINIIETKSKNIKEIEWHLDRLLDIPTEKGQSLFIELCNYYYSIDPQAADEYMAIYKEYYEEDLPNEEKSNTKKRTIVD